MRSAVIILALYVAALWWLYDRGRTPVLALALHKGGGALRGLALDLGALSMDMQRAAHRLIKDRSLAE